MKKMILTLLFFALVVSIIFAGCSLGKGDFDLERSKGIKITYVDSF